MGADGSWGCLARLVSRSDAIGYRIAHTNKEMPAAVQVAPPLGMASLRIIAQVQVGHPGYVVHHSRVGWPLDICLAAVTKFVLRPIAAPRTGDQQHQCATAAAAAS